MTDRNPPARRVLLLQGPRSPFFMRLADALEARGAEVRRVLFCPGDALYWRGRTAHRFRGRIDGWGAAAERLIREEGVTDVVGLGDGRRLHADAFMAARRAGARVHVVEQGFLRPGFLTVEPDALGGWRPTVPELASAPEPGAAPRWRSAFAAFAAMDAGYDLANLVLGPLTYPRYRTHAPHGPLKEWAGWAGKLARWPARRRARAAALREIASATGPLFLFALQLEADFMIRRKGPPDGLRGALRRVMASFAAQAPEEARLIVKPHPLDPQLAPWARLVREGPAAKRTIWLDGGELEALQPRLAGMLTVNSTAGLSALRAGLPVLALGEAVYDRPGLTHQGGLDAFWRRPEAPDPGATRAFVGAMQAAIQVQGGFDGEGMGPGAEAVAEHILSREAAPGAARAA